MAPHPHNYFNDLYRIGATPWTLHKEFPLFGKFLKMLPAKTKILDLGCGSGWMGIKAAKAGHSVWGIDLSPVAISKARQDSAVGDVNKRTDWRVGDGLDLPYQSNFFHGLIDRGFFHHLDKKSYPRYFTNINRVLNKSSFVWLAVFSKKNIMPHTFDRKDIKEIFKPRFEIINFAQDKKTSFLHAHLNNFILRKNEET